ncbi:MAG: MEKHLA domain-containing protein [Planktothrix sp. GU0601_MAG3]|nr:MAG: MEKHLA domain-containing protein [Planktothrix sp. GU0601_MAG3]
MITPWKQDRILIHTQRLLRSYQHWTGETLLDLNDNLEEVAEGLFYAPFVLVSHGIETRSNF